MKPSPASKKKTPSKDIPIVDVFRHLGLETYQDRAQYLNLAAHGAQTAKEDVVYISRTSGTSRLP